MKHRRINATLKRALPPIAALAFITILLFAALSLAGMTAVQPMRAASAQNVKHVGQIERAEPPTSTGTWTPASAAADVTTYNTLRVYGAPGWPNLPGNMGAGSGVVNDGVTGLLAEDQPYTEPLSVFNPQLAQAPRKDSITWNPLWMSRFETLDENLAKELYEKIFATHMDASEKVWFRMWYEPEHWDKDMDADSEFDRDPITGEPTDDDEWYPAIMQEFTYMLVESRSIAEKPEPMAGQAGTVSFVFPVGMMDVFDRYGYGLTSLDANFDGIPDIVHVESELTLFDKTDIAADFDGDGVIIDPRVTRLRLL